MSLSGATVRGHSLFRFSGNTSQSVLCFQYVHRLCPCNHGRFSYTHPAGCSHFTLALKDKFPVRDG